MNDGIKQLLLNLGGRLLDYGVDRLSVPKQNPIEERIQHIDRLIQAIPADWEVAETPPAPLRAKKNGIKRRPRGIFFAQEEIATGYLPCAVGHFSTSSGLLKEAIQFRDEGMTSNEILDRIAAVLEEQNAPEREELSPDKILHLQDWERPIAEEALSRQWYKGRFSHFRHNREGARHSAEGVREAITEVGLGTIATSRGSVS